MKQFYRLISRAIRGPVSAVHIMRYGKPDEQQRMARSVRRNRDSFGKRAIRLAEEFVTTKAA